MFLFGSGGDHAPGEPGCRSELRRASRAGAQNSIQDAGALRAPARTNDVFEFWVLIFDQVLIIFDDFRV